MNIGKRIRMGSIFRKETGGTVIVAVDHGGIAGPMEGINDAAALVRDCIAGGADSIMTTRGFARAAEVEWDRHTSLILRVTGGFTILGGGFEEEMISSAETALLYGACGVAATVKFGHRREGQFTMQTSLLADSCERWGLPLIIEAMARGKEIKHADPFGIALAARAAAEIGADVVKTYYTGDQESFRRVIEGCPVPVVILGGEKSTSLEQVLTDVREAMDAGARGIAIGRNIWQHGRTRAMVEAMAALVHEQATVQQALALIGRN